MEKIFDVTPVEVDEKKLLVPTKDNTEDLNLKQDLADCWYEVVAGSFATPTTTITLSNNGAFDCSQVCCKYQPRIKNGLKRLLRELTKQ